MSLTKLDQDKLRETARTKYSLEPDGSCGNRLVHASRDVLTLLDALEESEQEKGKWAELCSSFTQSQHAYLREMEGLKAQLATVEKERDIAKRNAQTVCSFLQTKDDAIERLEQQVHYLEHSPLQAELATAQETIDALKSGVMADATGHMHRCAKVNGVWSCAKGCAVTELSTLRTTHQASVEALKRVKDAGEYLWIVLASASGGDWTKQTPEWQEAAGKARDDYFAAINPQQALGEDEWITKMAKAEDGADISAGGLGEGKGEGS